MSDFSSLKRGIVGCARRGARVVSNRPAALAILLICIFATIRYETFLSAANIFNLLRQNSMVGLLALGMMLTMITGGIDLSLGATLAVGGVVAAAISPWGSGWSIAAAITLTLALGIINGLLITQAGIQPFIATLVMNMAARGLLLYATVEQSVPVSRSADGIRWLGRGWIGPFPVPVLLLLALYLIAAFTLSHTRGGRHLYAVGDNDEAARLMGLRVPLIRTAAYGWSAAIGGLAGAMLSGRLGVAQPIAGFGWELAAITAVIIGSITRTGWRPSPGGTLCGVLLLAVVFNLFNLEGTINSYWQWVLRGGFLLFVVFLQSWLSYRRDA